MTFKIFVYTTFTSNIRDFTANSKWDLTINNLLLMLSKLITHNDVLMALLPNVKCRKIRRTDPSLPLSFTYPLFKDNAN